MKCQLCDTRTVFDDGLCDYHAHISLLQMRETVGRLKAGLIEAKNTLEDLAMKSEGRCVCEELRHTAFPIQQNLFFFCFDSLTTKIFL